MHKADLNGIKSILVGIGVLAAASSHAQIIIGNLGTDSAGTDVSAFLGGAGGMAFTSSTSFTLGSVDLRLVVFPGPSISVKIYDNDMQGTPLNPSDDLPGTAQFTLSNPSFVADGVTVNTYNFQDPSQHVLSAGTYWVVAYDASDTGTEWRTGSTAPSGSPSAAHFGVATSSTEFLSVPDTRTPPSPQPNFVYQVNVPEPSEYAAMAAFGLVAFALLRSRRDRFGML